MQSLPVETNPIRSSLQRSQWGEDNQASITSSSTLDYACLVPASTLDLREALVVVVPMSVMAWVILRQALDRKPSKNNGLPASLLIWTSTETLISLRRAPGLALAGRQGVHFWAYNYTRIRFHIVLS